MTPLAIIVSAAIAALISYQTIQTNRRVARVRATLDVLFRLESDQEFLEASSTFKDVRDSRGLCSLLEEHRKSNKDIDEGLRVDTYLNHIELICNGILEDTIDEVFVFQHMRGSIIHDWHHSAEYVRQLRVKHDNPRIHQKLEQIATAWDEGYFITLSSDPEDFLLQNNYSGDAQDQKLRNKFRTRRRRWLEQRRLEKDKKRAQRAAN